jgi:MoaA/NifB/PqqE/SkfB family radical SAM enzyme
MAKVNETYGSLKILWHQDKLKSLLEETVTAPVYVRIKPTNQCNHSCFYCSYDPEFEYILSERFKRTDKIPKEKMMEILSDFKDMGVKAVTYSGGGEPLVYPHIVETMRKTLENNIDLSIITNGQLLNGERADVLTQAKWVRVSLDSHNPELFSETRRVPETLFHELIDNLADFAKRKNSDCEFGINFVIHKKNADKIYEAAEFFRNLGMNHLKTTPLYVPEGFAEYHSSIKENVIEQIKKAQQKFEGEDFSVYDTYEKDVIGKEIHQRMHSRCYIMQIIPVIGADSSVYFCHDKTYTDKGMLGSLTDKSFKELWFSEEANKKFKSLNPRIDCPEKCTYVARNDLINSVLDCYGDHINFI